MTAGMQSDTPEAPSRPDTERVRRRLTDSYMPAVALWRFDREVFYPREISGEWIAYYFYPGMGDESTGPEGAEADRYEHQAFRDHHTTLQAAGVRPVGISSQTTEEQHATIQANQISHTMLCDPDLTLAASSLNLPTFQVDETQRYRRLTLVTRAGLIKWCIYPVDRPDANPSQVLSWLKLNG